MLHSNTWNHLTVRQQINSGSFKNYVSNKLFVNKLNIYINRIWHKINYKGWKAIKYNQPLFWVMVWTLVLLSRLWKCPLCNGYRRRKWTRRHEFKSLTRLIAFHNFFFFVFCIFFDCQNFCQFFNQIFLFSFFCIFFDCQNFCQFLNQFFLFLFLFFFVFSSIARIFVSCCP